MKKNGGFLLVGILLLALFIALSIYTFHSSRTILETGYLASEGNAAANFAGLTAANIRLTDEQVERLRACSYGELMASDENEALREMMQSDSFLGKVHFAYVMVHLPDEEVVYHVTADMKEQFDAPVGTKLDILWLLDVEADKTAGEQADEANAFTRYAYYIPEDEKIFAEAPTFIFNSSEWGDHICGYAPLKTTEGHYIGVVGVEMEAGDYFQYCEQAVLALGVLMSVTLLLLSLLFAYAYLRYHRMQFDKVYVDALVQVYNRSYYNNRLCKYLNCHRIGKRFAMLIADVDWFKKVNDTFGHEVGDEVLIELGAILVETFGRTQVIRLGGEEFVVALWFDSESVLREKLDALFRTIEERRFSSRDITLSISLGGSLYEPSDVNGWLLSSMLRAADCKLYEAKESGRKRYLLDRFDPEKTYAKVKTGCALVAAEDSTDEAE